MQVLIQLKGNLGPAIPAFRELLAELLPNHHIDTTNQTAIQSFGIIFISFSMVDCFSFRVGAQTEEKTDSLFV